MDLGIRHVNRPHVVLSLILVWFWLILGRTRCPVTIYTILCFVLVWVTVYTGLLPQHSPYILLV